MSVSNHKIFVEKKDLKTKGLRPSTQELYDLMHLVSCLHAEARWKDEWSFCPVCCAFMNADGTILHKTRKEIEV